jgi:osmotically-inducible protein OsmY
MARMVTFLLGAAAGFAAGYFLDPSSGRRRRHQTRDRAFSKARHGKREAARQAAYAAGRAQGVVHKMTPSHPTGEPADDITLAHRVETEIFRAPDAPKGRVSVNAENGVVFLRGELDDPQWIARLGDDAARVTGVAAVRNLLHTPVTPAPAAPGTH